MFSCFFLASQLLGKHPSALQDTDIPCINVVMLLEGPFDTALNRMNVLGRHLRQMVSTMSNKTLLGSPLSDEHALVLCMEGIESMLINERASQHGNHPSHTSGHALDDILKRVDMTGALTDFAARHAVYAAVDRVERLQAMHNTMGRIIVRALNMPLVLGEAAELVRSWTRVSLNQTDKVKVHRVFGSMLMLSCSLLEAPSFGPLSTFVADGTPTAPPHGIAWGRAAVELLDATWNAGEHHGVGWDQVFLAPDESTHRLVIQQGLKPLRVIWVGA